MYRDYYKAVNKNGAMSSAMIGRYKEVFGLHLPKEKDSSILDYGAGAGFFLEWLFTLGYKNIEGVDIDPGMIELCQNKPFRVSQFNEFDFNEVESSFDFVVLKDVIEHVERDAVESFLRRLFLMLKPGGKLLLVTPNASSSFASHLRYIDPTHVNGFSENSISYWLRLTGFNLQYVGGDDYWKVHGVASAIRAAVRFFFRLLRRAEAIAEFAEYGKSMILSNNIVVLAQRPQ